MAMNFGVGNRSIAFNPTSAFPLDARSYFESYEAAVAAAATAEMAGSTNTQYYIGQSLVVVENNIVTQYVIEANGSLSKIGGEIAVDENFFTFEDGKLSLIDIDSAEVGSHLAIGEEGKLIWVKPVDSYSKSEVYTKQETDSKIAAAAHLKRKIVDSTNDIDIDAADADQYVYMVPVSKDDFSDTDRYDEYMVVIIVDDENVEARFIEKVGSWEVDLTDYAKTSDVETALSGKVDKADGYRLMSIAEGNRLAAIKDLIQDVNVDDFTIDENNHLNLKDIPISKVSGLQSKLDEKVTAIPNYTLLSPTDKSKLDALVISEDGKDVEISGKVNASNVEGLEDWITDHAATTPGLSENNFTDELLEKLQNVVEGAEKNYIRSVDVNQLNVDTNGKLSVKAIDASIITGLQSLLDDKASNDSVSEIADALNSFKVGTEKRLDDLESALTWTKL